MDDHLIQLKLATRPAAVPPPAAAAATHGSQAPHSLAFRSIANSGYSPPPDSRSPRPSIPLTMDIFVDPTNPLPTWEIKTEVYKKILETEQIKQIKEKTAEKLLKKKEPSAADAEKVADAVPAADAAAGRISPTLQANAGQPPTLQPNAGQQPPLQPNAGQQPTLQPNAGQQPPLQTPRQRTQQRSTAQKSSAAGIGLDQQSS